MFLMKSGFVSDEEIKQRESKLREALKDDRQFQVKEGTSVEVAQVRFCWGHNTFITELLMTCQNNLFQGALCTHLKFQLHFSPFM